jgi:hypothetical protein
MLSRIEIAPWLKAKPVTPPKPGSGCILIVLPMLGGGGRTLSYQGVATHPGFSLRGRERKRPSASDRSAFFFPFLYGLSALSLAATWGAAYLFKEGGRGELPFSFAFFFRC